MIATGVEQYVHAFGQGLVQLGTDNWYPVPHAQLFFVNFGGDDDNTSDAVRGESYPRLVLLVACDLDDCAQERRNDPVAAVLT